MARIRTIKPDAFKSESLSRLDYFTRWTFAGLWTYLDDDGYGRADVRLIRAELFPLDDDATLAKVGKAVTALLEAECVCLFTVDGRDYIHAPNFKRHQRVNRPTESRIPHCPEHDGGASGEVASAPHALLTDDALRAHDRKGKEGKGTGKRESAVADEDFDHFWTLYPRKVAKPDALKAWAKAVKIADPAVILASLSRQVPTLAKAEAKFIPYPATWLNAERWADVLEVAKPRDNRPEGW